MERGGGKHCHVDIEDDLARGGGEREVSGDDVGRSRVGHILDDVAVGVDRDSASGTGIDQAHSRVASERRGADVERGCAVGAAEKNVLDVEAVILVDNKRGIGTGERGGETPGLCVERGCGEGTDGDIPRHRQLGCRGIDDAALRGRKGQVTAAGDGAIDDQIAGCGGERNILGGAAGGQGSTDREAGRGESDRTIGCRGSDDSEIPGHGVVDIAGIGAVERDGAVGAEIRRWRRLAHAKLTGQAQRCCRERCARGHRGGAQGEVDREQIGGGDHRLGSEIECAVGGGEENIVADTGSLHATVDKNPAEISRGGDVSHSADVRGGGGAGRRAVGDQDVGIGGDQSDIAAIGRDCVGQHIAISARQLDRARRTRNACGGNNSGSERSLRSGLNRSAHSGADVGQFERGGVVEFD